MTAALFAVGVYLPLSSSMPIFIGGMVRRLVDSSLRARHTGPTTDEESAAEGDKSPGVLMASGYIAGGAIAGIIIAFVAGVLSSSQARIDDWASKYNPFYGGEHANLLSLIPFVAITGALYLAGRGRSEGPGRITS